MGTKFNDKWGKIISTIKIKYHNLKLKDYKLISWIMKKIKKLRDISIKLFISNRAVIFSWIILVSLLILLIGKVTLFITEYSFISEKEVQDSFFNKAYTLLLIIISATFIWYIFKNYRVSKKNNYIIFLVTTIYLVMRNNHSDKLWFSTYSYKYNFYYTDIIILISLFAILLLIRNIFIPNIHFYDRVNNWFKNLEKPSINMESYSLIQDVPQIETIKNDNEAVIDEMITAINVLKPQNSFIIGVNSIWGLGKTSFLKRLDYNLNNQITNNPSPITFWFNAWQHQDEKSIINNFFNQLKKELSNYSGESISTVDNYLKEMLAIVDNKFLGFLKSVTDSFFQSGETIKDYYDELNYIIESIDRKIIVFVDDIDRLNKNEILETLRVLRNIANFKNIIFICGFDRDYVIKQSQIDNNFLDKIFNLEINLSSQNQKSYLIILNDLITNSSGLNEYEKQLLIETINKIFFIEEDNSFSELFLSSVDTTTKESHNLESISLTPSFFLESRRDVKKFYNELYINIKVLKKLPDIELADYILLKLLLFKYKWLQKYFSSKKMTFWLGSENVLKFTDENLEKLHLDRNISREDQTVIFSVFKLLFPSFAINGNSKKINQKRYFPIYLNNNIFNEAFSHTDLLDAIEKNKIEDLIINKVNGKENELKFKDDIKDFIVKSENIRNIEEYKQVIRLIKKNYFGLINEREIAVFINYGENTFGKDYNSLLESKIFTNSTDSFGEFLIELNNYYTKYPKDISMNNGHDLEGFFYTNRIPNFKILNKGLVKKLLVKILKKEIVENEEDPIKVMGLIHSGKEYYYYMFNFNLYYKDFKSNIINYLSDNFSLAFLTKSAPDTIRSLDLMTTANIFEVEAERKEIINDAERIIAEKITLSSDSINRRDYLLKGWDKFINFIESKKAIINPAELSKYEMFVDYLHTYRSLDFIKTPTENDVKVFKNRKKQMLLISKK